MLHPYLRLGAFIVALWFVAANSAEAATNEDLTDLSLEQLGDIRVTSVSKKPERLSQAPASIYVITADDIRRAGATSIPEALRLAPNLQVARVSSAGYSISARGMNGSNTASPNRLLVMIDGRSVYSPLFSGVFWDVQDVMLEDIDRIEVISGPGSTLWGVNAVNGVINVITRSAANSQGVLLSLGAGQPDSAAAFRYGGSFGSHGYFRGYAKAITRDNTETAAGDAVEDAGHKVQVGFLVDWKGTDDRFSLNGNAYRGTEGQPAPGAISVSGTALALGDIKLSGSNLTGRWDRQLSGDASLSVQAYYDRTERTVPPTFAEKLDIFDLQLQHTLAPIGAHSLAWGFDYRLSHDRVVNSAIFAFLPADVDQHWSSLFVQDRMALRDTLHFTAGARLERNDYTGNEFLPSLRLDWNITPDHMVWAAASRAVRAPSRLDRDAYIPGVPPFLLDGGSAVRSEIADVYELGYRGQPSTRFSFSATAFHNEYDHVRSLEIDPTGTHFIFGSLMEGDATGLETWGKFQASSHWRLSAGLTALHERLRLKPGSNDVTGPQQTGNDPSLTWQLRSSWDIGATGQFDIGARHVSELEKNAVPAYTAFDVRFAWQVSDGLELAVAGHNLGGRHAEYGGLASRTEFDRDFILQLIWKQ